MRILQVNNSSSMVGGTANCSLSITRAFPDCEHSVHFTTFSSKEAEIAFSGHRVTCGEVTQSVMQGHDLVIFHNTPEQRFPAHIPAECVTVFYQHSAARSCSVPRSRCDFRFVVSEFLADRVGLQKDTVLYQPVEKADRIEDGRTRSRVIRYCTPNSAKWPEGMEKLYEAISKELSGAFEFLFIGAPEFAQKRLKAIVPDAVFLPASPTAIRFLGASDVLLYSGPEETYGRVVCEAQRSGVYPIVSNIGGFREQICGVNSGQICGSDNEFVAALYYYSREKPSIEKLIECGDSRGSHSVFRKSFLRALKGKRA